MERDFDSLVELYLKCDKKTLAEMLAIRDLEKIGTEPYVCPPRVVPIDVPYPVYPTYPYNPPYYGPDYSPWSPNRIWCTSASIDNQIIKN